VDDHDHHFRRELAMSLLKAMIYDIGNEIWQSQRTEPKRTRAEAIFNKFIMLVKDNYRKERRVSWYGEQLCITPKYLSSICKKNTGKTASDWIRIHVMEDIRYYLKFTDFSVKQVSDVLGFPNPSFFGKYVRTHFGMSPAKFRMG
jgi:AraC-like DNA-binding protein